MGKENYKFEYDENGIRVMVDTKTGEKIPINELIDQAILEGKLITMEQAMLNKNQKE